MLNARFIFVEYWAEIQELKELCFNHRQLTTEYWVLVNEMLGNCVRLQERDTIVAWNVCLTRRSFFIAAILSLLHLSIFTRVYPPQGKRWRLVHLPIVLSARKPSQRSQKRTETLQNLQTRLHNVLSLGRNIVKKLTFFVLCRLCWVRKAVW